MVAANLTRPVAKELLQPQNFRHSRITFESWAPYKCRKPTRRLVKSTLREGSEFLKNIAAEDDILKAI
jgi:hypothetical protein